jgi:hypothetical protein
MKTNEAVEAAVKMLGKNEFDVSEIVTKISYFDEFKELTLDEIHKKITGYLGKNAKSKTPVYAKSLNKKGKPTRSTYHIIKKKERPIILLDKVKDKKTIKTINKIDESVGMFPDFNNPDTLFGTSKLYSGKAGEFAVVSELLFREYNASVMSVDEGIDITASKNDKFFFIQVKSTNFDTGKISISIKPNKFVNNSGSDIYYVIVFRYTYKGVNTNRYIVIQNKLMEHYIFSGEIAQNSNGGVTIKIKQKNGHLYLHNGNKEAQIDHWLDNFDLIK